jgi:hypothetical protein
MHIPGWVQVHKSRDPSPPDEEPEKQQVPQQGLDAAQALQHVRVLDSNILASLLRHDHLPAPQVVAQSGQPGAATTGSGILGHADRALRSSASKWLKELLPELEERTAVS